MLTQNIEFCSKMSLEEFTTPRARSPTPYLALFCGVAAQPERRDRLGHWCSSFTPSINYVPHITPTTPFYGSNSSLFLVALNLLIS